MKFEVWYTINGHWDSLNNNGSGFAFKEAQEVQSQLKEQGHNAEIQEMINKKGETK